MWQHSRVYDFFACSIISIWLIQYRIGGRGSFSPRCGIYRALFKEDSLRNVSVISYLIGVFLADCLIRFILCVWREFELHHPPTLDLDPKKPPSKPEKTFWPSVKDAFTSKHHSALVKDYWHPFALGFFELFFYPLLMVESEWIPIGWWIGLKTAASWKGWNEKRENYSRFLIGNALIIIMSIILADLFIGQPCLGSVCW